MRGLAEATVFQVITQCWILRRDLFMIKMASQKNPFDVYHLIPIAQLMQLVLSQSCFIHYTQASIRKKSYRIQFQGHNIHNNTNNSIHHFAKMSLFVVGSCSRITNSIVSSLVLKNLYKNVLIADLLPTYNTFHRFYDLRKHIAAEDANNKTNIQLTKLIDYNDIYDGVHKSDHVLFVTHDYYQNVASKTKIMNLTAEASKTKTHVLYVTPVEYDHYGYEKPETTYEEAENKVRKLNPNATVLRTDVVEHAELYNYIANEKSLVESFLFRMQSNEKFSPKLVSQTTINNAVHRILTENIKGKKLVLAGDKEVPYTTFKGEIQTHSSGQGCAGESGQFRSFFSKYYGNLGTGEVYA